MKIGLLGCGAIGHFLLEQINEEKQIPNAEIVAVLDERENSIDKLQTISEQFSFTVYQELEPFLNAPIDIVIECANIEAVHQYAKKVVETKEMLIISIGALVDSYFLDELKNIAEANETKVYLPTGAVGGLDLLKAANSMGKLEKVKLVSRKPVNALADEQIEKEEVLFEGIAKAAIEQFPKNANVAIAISLAGIGVEKTEVKIIADPKVTRNIHTIEMEGDFGRSTISIENNPSPTNPKTSYLTSLSILSTIQSLHERVIVG